jgi:hypothetical protein
MTNDAPVLEFALPRDRILWKTRWQPAGRYAAMVADDGRLECGPVEKVEWKTERGDCRAWVRTWRIPLVEGAIYMRSLDDGRGADIRFAVVRAGQLVDITKEQAEDLYDPAGADERARCRHAAWERREYAVHRSRRPGLTAGLVYQTNHSPEAYMYVERATAKECWWRRAKPEEIAAYKAEFSAEAISPTP